MSMCMVLMELSDLCPKYVLHLEQNSLPTFYNEGKEKEKS
jgi:hypothetical protein